MSYSRQRGPKRGQRTYKPKTCSRKRPSETRSSKMTLKVKLISFVLLTALLGAAILQRSLIREARAEHRRCQNAAQESNAPTPSVVEESEETRAAKRELLRLRNEVHQLRAQEPDLDRLRSENERLSLRIAEMSKPRLPPTEEQGFVSR